MKLILLLYSVSFFYTQVLLAEPTYFFNRPYIESIQARKPTLQMPNGWEKHKNGMMVAAAELLALYPNAELYFLSRDGEYLYDMAKVLTIGNADAKRIHLLSVSRQNMRDPLLSDYLKQEGINVRELNGRQAVLVDTGWAGSIPKVLKEAVEPGVVITPHFLHSKNPDIASSRVSLENVVAGKVNVKNPGEHHSELLELEHIPHYSDLAVGFGQEYGKINAFSNTVPADASPVLEMMADIRHFAEKPEIENRFDELRQVMKELYGAAIGSTQLSSSEILSNMRMLKENGASHFLEDLKEHSRLHGSYPMERFVSNTEELLRGNASVSRPEPKRNVQQSSPYVPPQQYHNGQTIRTHVQTSNGQIPVTVSVSIGQPTVSYGYSTPPPPPPAIQLGIVNSNANLNFFASATQGFYGSWNYVNQNAHGSIPVNPRQEVHISVQNSNLRYSTNGVCVKLVRAIGSHVNGYNY